MTKDNDVVVALSLSERKVIVEQAIKRSGFTLEELLLQAKNNRFETLQAKLSWMVISADEKSSTDYKINYSKNLKY